MSFTLKEVVPLRDSDYVGEAQRMLAYLEDRWPQSQLGTSPAPDKLLAAADDYCIESNRRMMHIGNLKGTILHNIVKKVAPKTCLELGSYCGYSTVAMASALTDGSRLISVEANAENAAVAKKFINLAGSAVSKKVTLLNQKSDDVIKNLQQDFSVDTLDFVFIDHWKDLYLSDLKLLETLGLLRKGTVIMADNLIYPGAPDYRDYVMTSGKYDTELIMSILDYTDAEDAMGKSVFLG